MPVGFLERPSSLIERARRGGEQIPELHSFAAKSLLPERHGLPKCGERRFKRIEHGIVDFPIHPLAAQFRLEDVLPKMVSNKRTEPGNGIDDVEKACTVRSQPRIHGYEGRASQGRIIGIFERSERGAEALNRTQAVVCAHLQRHCAREMRVHGRDRTHHAGGEFFCKGIHLRLFKESEVFFSLNREPELQLPAAAEIRILKGEAFKCGMKHRARLFQTKEQLKHG